MLLFFFSVGSHSGGEDFSSWPPLIFSLYHIPPRRMCFFCFLFIYFLFYQLAATVRKSAMEVAGAMTAQDKITSSAMAAPAKINRKKKSIAFWN
jgi:hypothetical protein